MTKRTTRASWRFRAGAKPGRRRSPTASIAILLSLALQSAQAQTQTASEYQIKAAFLYNFVKFVEWPPGATAKSVRVCVIGNDPIGDEVDALAGKPIGDRVIEVKNIQSPANVSSCQVLFVAASEAPNLKSILTAARGAAVLTVGDTRGFAEHGVVINFYMDSRNLRFEINVEAA